MVKLRGFIQAALVISSLFIASIAAAGYVIFAPLHYSNVSSPETHEESYSSESLPSPGAAAFGFDTVVLDLRRSPDPSPGRRVKLSATPLKNIFYAERQLKYASPLVSVQPTSDSQPLPAGGVNSKVETAYYDIFGDTETELRDEMNAKGHVSDDGETYDAHTHWSIGWKYWYRKESGSCAVGSVLVTAEVTVNLPRWQNQSSGSEALQSQWNTFIKALESHENSHRDFALSGAQQIYDSLLRLPAQETCDALQPSVSETGKVFFQK